MTERAAHLVDAVLPWVPVRQWVLTVPYRLRYQLAWNHGLSRAVLRVYSRVLLGLYARGARARGVPGGRTGSVTVLQRAGGTLNGNLHFHTLVLDGVFTEAPGGALAFHPARGRATPRSRRYWRRSATGCSGCWCGTGSSPPTTRGGRRIGWRTSPPCWRGSSGRRSRAGWRWAYAPGRGHGELGDARDTPTVTSRGLRQAHLDGFDLHANVWVAANNRAGLERLSRYVLRPPFAQERLRLRSDGRVALDLKTVWHDGTRELVFEPLEFLERLAAMTLRPETNLLFAMACWPRARWRERVVVYGRVAPEPTASTAPLAARPEGTGVKRGPRAWTWAALMHRAFAIDVVACSHCGDRLRLIATLHNPAVIRNILAHLGIAPSGPGPGPAPPAPSATAP